MYVSRTTRQPPEIRKYRTTHRFHEHEQSDRSPHSAALQGGPAYPAVNKQGGHQVRRAPAGRAAVLDGRRPHIASLPPTSLRSCAAGRCGAPVAGPCAPRHARASRCPVCCRRAGWGVGQLLRTFSDQRRRRASTSQRCGISGLSRGILGGRATAAACNIVSGCARAHARVRQRAGASERSPRRTAPTRRRSS